MWGKKKNSYLNDPLLLIEEIQIWKNESYYNLSFCEGLNKPFSQFFLLVQPKIKRKKEKKDEGKHSCICIKLNEWVKGELCIPRLVFMPAEEERLAGRLGAVTGPAQQGAEVWCREWEVTAQCHTVHRVSPHQAERERDGDKEREGEKVVMESEKKTWEIYKFCACACMNVCTYLLAYMHALLRLFVICLDLCKVLTYGGGYLCGLRVFSITQLIDSENVFL